MSTKTYLNSKNKLYILLSNLLEHISAVIKLAACGTFVYSPAIVSPLLFAFFVFIRRIVCN